MTPDVDEDAVEELDLGAPPRPPLSRRTRRWLLAGGVAVVAAAGVTVALLAPARTTPSAAPSPGASTPAVESSAGFAAGPVLVTVGGRDALQSPSLPGLGARRDPVVLDPAPDLVAVLAEALPGFRDARGGRIPSDVSGPNGIYLAGTYDGDGGPVTVTLYSVRAPGTTFGTDQFVSRTRFDDVYTLRTDVSVFTGTGWWVHAVSLGPDDPSAAATGEKARLVPLVEDPRLVAT